jgi:ribosomal protein S18 acetylase RimI-like enzyme
MTPAGASPGSGPAGGGALPPVSEPYATRPLRPDDLDGISRVHWRACRIAYRFMSWSYTEDEVRRWYAGKLEGWDWGQVACDAGGGVVAFIATIGAHVDQLYVDPDHQRRGLGRALLAAALARGLRPATLHVLAENRPARRLYEACGFREAASWPDEEQNGVLMLLYRLNEHRDPDTPRSSVIAGPDPPIQGGRPERPG